MPNLIFQSKTGKFCVWSRFFRKAQCLQFRKKNYFVIVKMTYNTNSLLKSRTPYDIHMMNIYNRHSNEMNYNLPDIFFPKELNVENYSETVFIPNTNFFTIGKNLSEWGCDNFKTNSQLVIVQAAVPNGNVSENSSTDVDAYGMFIFEPFLPFSKSTSFAHHFKF